MDILGSALGSKRVRLSITWATYFGRPEASWNFPGAAFEGPFGYQNLQYHDTVSFGHDNATFGGFWGSALGSKRVRLSIP